MFVHFTYGQFEIVSYIFNQTMTIKKKFNRIHVLVVKIINGLINYQNNHDCRPRIYSFDTFYWERSTTLLLFCTQVYCRLILCQHLSFNNSTLWMSINRQTAAKLPATVAVCDALIPHVGKYSHRSRLPFRMVFNRCSKLSAQDITSLSFVRDKDSFCENAGLDMARKLDDRRSRTPVREERDYSIYCWARLEKGAILMIITEGVLFMSQAKRGRNPPQSQKMP